MNNVLNNSQSDYRHFVRLATNQCNLEKAHHCLMTDSSNTYMPQVDSKRWFLCVFLFVQRCHLYVCVGRNFVWYADTFKRALLLTGRRYKSNVSGRLFSEVLVNLYHRQAHAKLSVDVFLKQTSINYAWILFQEGVVYSGRFFKKCLVKTCWRLPCF